MTAVETRRFDFENGRSVHLNNTRIICGRISDAGLYSFCYRQIGGEVRPHVNLPSLEIF